MAVGGAEEHFAKKLANNDKRIRDRAVKRLQAWISSRPSTGTGFSELELLKIWKGLFYCFWMSDKPLIQEELAENISKLQHSFKNKESGFAFIITFFKTMHKEWHGIDRLRMDKFYLLVRMFIRENFEFLKTNRWDPSICSKLCDIYKDGPLHPSKETVPIGMKLHLCGVFLNELSNIAEEKVSAEIISLLLEPFFVLAAETKSQVVSRAVKDGVLEKLLEIEEKRLRKEQEDDEEEDDDQEKKEKMLQVNCQDIADKLFSLGTDRQILGRNRNLLYLYSKKFKKVVSDDTEENEKGRKRKLEQEKESEELPDVDIPVKKQKKKKKKENLKSNGIADTEEAAEVENEADDGKKKKRKRSQKENGEDASNKQVTATPKMKKNLRSNGIADTEEVAELENEPEVKQNDGKKKKKKRNQKENGEDASNKQVTATPRMKKSLRSNGIADTEEVAEVENEPEVKQNDGKKKKRKQSQKDNGQDASNKQVTATPKMKKKQSKEKLDINGNSEDDIASKEPIVKASSGLKVQDKSSTPEMIVEKTIKELRNQVSSAQNTDNTPVKKKKKQGIQGDETPFAAFTKTTTTPPAFFRKAVSRTEPRKAKTTKLTCPNSEPQNSKKKVRIHLHKNKAQSHLDYAKSLTSSPDIPFDASRTPEFGLLKTKSLTKSMPVKAGKKHTPSKRSKAIDYF